MRSTGVGLIVLATLVFVATVGLTELAGQQSAQVQRELNMAMENMAKVMLDMPMDDRPAYMMQQQE